MQNKVIILQGRELGYQVVKALGAKGIASIVIYGHERDEIAQYSKYAVESYRLPRFFDEPGLLLDLLERKVDAWRGTMIIPTGDHGVKFLAANKEVLSVDYIVPIPDPDVIDSIVNKRSLYKLAGEMGISVPKVHCPRSMDELETLQEKITFPCLLKPGLGHLFASRFDFKMIEVQNFADLAGHYVNLTQDFTQDEFNMMICDIIPGPDSDRMVQYVSYMDRSGEMLASMTSRKMRQDPPRYGQGRIAKSERVPGVDELSRRLLNGLGYRGFSEIEWKYDARDGAYKLIEINPRFIFYIGLCVACGINFPYIQYADLVLNKKIRHDSFKENVYWIHEYKDALHTILNHKMEKISFQDYVRPYLREKTLAIFDLNDMRPFYEQWRQHITNMMRKII